MEDIEMLRHVRNIIKDEVPNADIYVGYVDLKTKYPVIVIDVERTRPGDVPGVSSYGLNVSVLGYAYNYDVDAIAKKVASIDGKRYFIDNDNGSIVFVLSSISNSYMSVGADIMKIKRIDFTVYHVGKG